jgi:hypothetical protein
MGTVTALEFGIERISSMRCDMGFIAINAVEDTKNSVLLAAAVVGLFSAIMGVIAATILLRRAKLERSKPLDTVPSVRLIRLEASPTNIWIWSVLKWVVYAAAPLGALVLITLVFPDIYSDMPARCAGRQFQRPSSLCLVSLR